MIQLERHIEILLLSNDCVIVPGLGGFMAHHVEARYDAGDGLYLPPLRTLGFNPQLRMNDSLLVQSYVEAYDISYPEALRRIEGEVEELRQHLDNEGSYELNDIGTLNVNEEGNIVFEPCEAGILTPSLYGLSSFAIEPLAAQPADNAVAEVAVADSQRQANAASLEKTAVPESTDSADDENADGADDEEGTIKIKVAWIRNAVAVAAAVIAFFLVSTPITNSVDTNARMAGVNNGAWSRFTPKEMVKGEVKMESRQVRKTLAKTDTLALTKATNSTENKQDTTTTMQMADMKGFCIVMASHVTRANANDYVEKLHKEGYDDAYVYVHNRIVRVVYGNYQQESDAYKQLRKLRDGEYFEQSWIYEKK